MLIFHSLLFLSDDDLHRGEDKNEAALQRKHAEKAELDKLNLAYAKQMQRYSTYCVISAQCDTPSLCLPHHALISCLIGIRSHLVTAVIGGRFLTGSDRVGDVTKFIDRHE